MPMLRWNDESEISTAFSNRQSHVRLAALATGGFVAVWEDRLTPSSTPVLMMRVYSSNGGAAAAASVVIGGNSSFPRAAPAVAGTPGGGILVAYTDGDVAAGTTGISLRRFTGLGTLQAITAVTQPVPGRTDAAPSIASLGDGRTAVAYTSSASGGPLLTIVNAVGQAGPQIAAGFTATATAPVVATTPGGPFVAVGWSDTATRQVQVQLVDPATGLRVGPVLAPASYAAGIALAETTIAWLSPGVLAVAWTRTLEDNAAIASDVMMRLYTVAPSGVVAALGAPFQVNSRSLGSQLDVHLTPTPEEGVVASWQDGGAIRLQAFDGLGNRIGGEYRVNVEAAGTGASIAALTDGRIAVAWQLAEDDPDTADLRLQIIDPRQGLVTGGDGADTLFGSEQLGDEIRGLDGNDTIRGLGGNDMIQGGAGDDELFGDDGDDTLQGGTGNDLLVGGFGANRLVGGRGDDTYRPGKSDTIVEKPGEGSDTIEGFTFDINLNSFPNVENVRLLGFLSTVNATGTAGPNILDGSGSPLINTLTGGGGDDIYVLGAGDVPVEVAGGGNDTIRTSALNIDLGTFTSIENVELLGALALSATGTTGDNRLNGEGNTAANKLTGLAGNDSYIVGAGDTVVEAADGGTDSVTSSTIDLVQSAYPNVETLILAGALPLSATGDAGNNSLFGQGNSAANVLAGGAGNDTYTVGLGDTIIETSGIDTVRSSTLSLDLAFYPGVENLTLLNGPTIHGTGNGGSNTLDASANTGANILTGLGGNDVYIVAANDTVVEAPGGGTDTVQSASSISLLTFANVENAILVGGAPAGITGSAAANVLNGANNSGANVLTGLGGDDTYQLGAGDTAIEAPGEGTDTVQTSAVDIDLASFPNVENITLTGALALKATGDAGNNTLSGAQNSAANVLAGLGGNDTYIVGAGDIVVEAQDGGSDTVLSAVSYTLAPGAAVEFLRNNTSATGLTLTGNALVQTITGAAGADTLAGGGGGDVLIGNGGTDSLTGGAGLDTFRFLLPSDSAVGAGRDSIIGFVSADGDRIDLSAIDANALLAGDQAFIFRGSAAFTGARGEARFAASGADVIVQGTLTGAAVAFEIRVAGKTSLVAGDFIL